VSEGFYKGGAYASSAIDTWSTPRDFYDATNAEFSFGLDAAALQSSTLCPDNWYGPDHPEQARQDAFARDWLADSNGQAVWLNPPYGRTIKEWVEKADLEAQKGATVVCLVPARTDTNWWWSHCISYEVRFIRGRLKFGNQPNSAPFPSALVIMRKETVNG